MPNLEGGARRRATGLENQAEQSVSRVRLLHLPPNRISNCGIRIANFPSLRGEADSHFAIPNSKSLRTCSSGESERDFAKVEVARSNRARSAKIEG